MAQTKEPKGKAEGDPGPKETPAMDPAELVARLDSIIGPHVQDSIRSDPGLIHRAMGAVAAQPSIQGSVAGGVVPAVARRTLQIAVRLIGPAVHRWLKDNGYVDAINDSDKVLDQSRELILKVLSALERGGDLPEIPAGILPYFGQAANQGAQPLPSYQGPGSPPQAYPPPYQAQQQYRQPTVSPWGTSGMAMAGPTLNHPLLPTMLPPQAYAPGQSPRWEGGIFVAAGSPPEVPAVYFDPSFYGSKPLA